VIVWVPGSKLDKSILLVAKSSVCLLYSLENTSTQSTVILKLLSNESLFTEYIIEGFAEILWFVSGSIIEILIESLNEGSLFSQYHSGIFVKIFILLDHSHHTGILAFSVHRSLIFSKSSFPGMNESNSMKYHFLTSSIGVIGLTTHRQAASYSYKVTSPSAFLGKLFTYPIVETINSPGVVSDGTFHVILEIFKLVVSTFVISLFVIYHHLTNHHRNSFKG
jgi:hypothetical protein